MPGETFFIQSSVKKVISPLQVTRNERKEVPSTYTCNPLVPVLAGPAVATRAKPHPKCLCWPQTLAFKSQETSMYF